MQNGRKDMDIIGMVKDVDNSTELLDYIQEMLEYDKVLA